MLCVKKLYNNDLMQLALIMSLLRLDYILYFNSPQIPRNNDNLIQNSSDYIHTKSLDHILLNYERQLFEDLNSLGRYNPLGRRHAFQNISAYLLNVERDIAQSTQEDESSQEDNAHAVLDYQEEVVHTDYLHTPNNPLLIGDPFFRGEDVENQETVKLEKLELDPDSDSLFNDGSSDNFGVEEGTLFDNNLLDESLAFSNIVVPKIEDNVPDNIFSESLNLEEIDGSLGSELTQEDMDLIEVLWKQDVDLGFSLESETASGEVKVDPEQVQSEVKLTKPKETEIRFDEKLKCVEGEECLKTENPDEELGDPWTGLQYTIDTETGEYVLKSGSESTPRSERCDNDLSLPLEDLDTLPLSLPDLLFEDHIPISVFDEERRKDLYDSDIRESSPLINAFGSSDSNSGASTSAQPDTGTDEEDFLTMIQTAQFHSPHPHSFQGHMNPYMRMNEQRWQDVAGLLDNTTGGVIPSGSHSTFSHHAVAALHNLGHPHHVHHHPGHHMGAYGPTHNVTLTNPQDHHHHHHHGVHPSSFPNINGTNLGSAVATSINLTGPAESIDSGASASYKMETPHDIMYFPNTSSEISNATDGFLSSILNDEDLQLMDMMGDGMYPMRMLDNNTVGSSGVHGMSSRMDMAASAERMDASSDSAVSSMGSERVASLSDNEWGDATSDSGHNTADHYALDYATKYRPYDYSYSHRQQTPGSTSSNNATLLGTDNRRTSVAQKKHHMFGKRFFQDQTYNTSPSSLMDIRNGPIGGSARPKAPEVKFPCALDHPGHLHTARSPLDHVHHNHTYNLPPESTGTMQRPVFRDKGKGKPDEEPHLTRDEKRARALNVPLSVDDIINLPMDEFNERLSKFDLSEPQLSLIRDIRRRGKNKVAAQNCRKRKLDQILTLADEVKDMRDRKNRLMAEREFMVSERQRVKDKFTQLYRHVLRNLRDPDGNPYSPNLYSLQQSADGTVIIVPKVNMTEPTKDKKPPQ